MRRSQLFALSLPAATLAAVLLASFPAGATPRTPSRDKPAQTSEASARKFQAAWNLMDSEGKGYVTADDFARGRAFAGRVFSALDRNGDGVIDRREFVTGADGLRVAEFGRLDRKHNGRVTHEEFVRGWNRDLFQALSHGRGYLTAADLRPGFGAAGIPAPPQAVAAAEPAPREPTVPLGFREMGKLCWIPLNDDHPWGIIFPWSLACR